jgi:hypothetical protein
MDLLKIILKKSKQPVYGKKNHLLLNQIFAQLRLDSDPWIVQPTEHYEELSIEEIIKRN